tara:strand:+ start:1081 stop:1260 length:180 start_codon:yes stop_codon:yes gene_type:complete
MAKVSKAEKKRQKKLKYAISKEQKAWDNMRKGNKVVAKHTAERNKWSNEIYKLRKQKLI